MEMDFSIIFHRIQARNSKLDLLVVYGRTYIVNWDFTGRDEVGQLQELVEMTLCC